MQTSTTFDQALSSLRDNGFARVPGEPAFWSKGLRWLFLVLIVLISLLLLGVPVFAALLWDEIEVTAGTVFGLVGVLVMTIGMLVLAVLGYRRRARFAPQERQDVTLEEAGLTLRGVGPIPWRDFGPAEHRMVRAEHDSGWVRRAVMELTPSGLVAVNEQLAPELRGNISPATGPFWRRGHRWIYVPGVAGMSQSEVMQLINTARDMFAPDPARHG